MRCPYCGGLDQERAVFCVNCGRDLRRAQQNPQPLRPPAAPAQQPRPAQTPRPSAQPSAAGRRPPAASPQPDLASLVAPAPAPIPEPAAPGPFPPRTLAQYEALLEPGRQAYTVNTSSLENGKKIVSIAYPRCASWQQAATLLQALKEQQEERYKTIIIRGFLPQQPDLYTFTNGQLQFDRDVRLGAQVGSRYVVETGSGYAADSIRFVLNE